MIPRLRDRRAAGAGRQAATRVWPRRQGREVFFDIKDERRQDPDPEVRRGAACPGTLVGRKRRTRPALLGRAAGKRQEGKCENTPASASFFSNALTLSQTRSNRVKVVLTMGSQAVPIGAEQAAFAPLRPGRSNVGARRSLAPPSLGQTRSNLIKVHQGSSRFVEVRL